MDAKQIKNKSFICSLEMAFVIAFIISPISDIIATALNIPLLDYILSAAMLYILFTLMDYKRKQNLKLSKVLIFSGFVMGILIAIVSGDIYFTF